MIALTKKNPILLILHQKNSSAGRVGPRLKASGYPLDIRRPRFGDTLPETLCEHAGVIVFGGPMSANDDEAYIRDEIDWLSVPLAEDAPLLGLCLGAQLMARKLGADVGPREDGMVEVGYYALEPTEAGRQLLEWPDCVHHFHREGFDLPSGATLLAKGETFENQAFAYGANAFALQFHVELTDAMVDAWTKRSARLDPRPGAQPRRMHLQGRTRHDWKTKAFLDRFLDLWLARDRRSPAMSNAAE